MILAIDTSTDLAGLALWEDGVLVAECLWRTRRSHTAQLLPRLREVQRHARVETAQLRGIAVALGPGSFTGLRVGIATAKALAWTLGLPLAGVPTLEAMAVAHAAAGLPVCPIMQAGRGDVYSARFQRGRSGWQQLAPFTVSTPGQVWAATGEPTVFCGDTDLVRAAAGADAGRAVWVEGAANVRRPGMVAELGRARLEQGDVADPAALQPLYLRRPSAEERQAAMQESRS